MQQTKWALLPLCLCLVMGSARAAYVPSEPYQASVYQAALDEAVLTGDYRADLVAVAASQLGYHEGDTEAELDGSNTEGSKNVTEYGYWVESLRDAPLYDGWCAMFVGWCIEQANIPPEVVKPATRSAPGDFQIPYTAWSDYDFAAGLPAMGDFVFYNWESSEQKECGDHMGIVLSVTPEEDKLIIESIEGNHGNRVATVLHTIDAETGQVLDYQGYVMGFGTLVEQTEEIDEIDGIEEPEETTEPDTPGRPALKDMKKAYSTREPVLFLWDATVDTTHYHLTFQKEGEDGTFAPFDRIEYATSGTGLYFPAGNYRVELQAVNYKAWTEDGLFWRYTDGEPVTFTITAK